MTIHNQIFDARIPRMIAPVALSATLLFTMPVSLHSQEGASPSLSKVERKNKAPASQEILRIKLPKPVEAKLKNGLTVLILEDHRAPYINVQLHIGGAGALFEPADRAGLANATAQMLREGTKSRTSVQIAEEIDRLGAALSAGSSFGSSDVVLSASGLSDNFDSWFAVAVDVLLHPSFPADELEKLLANNPSEARAHFALANLYAQQLDQPAKARDHYLRLLELEPQHPQGTAVRYWLEANP